MLGFLLWLFYCGSLLFDLLIVVVGCLGFFRLGGFVGLCFWFVP